MDRGVDSIIWEGPPWNLKEAPGEGATLLIAPAQRAQLFDPDADIF